MPDSKTEKIAGNGATPVFLSIRNIFLVSFFVLAITATSSISVVLFDTQELFWRATKLREETQTILLSRELNYKLSRELLRGMRFLLSEDMDGNERAERIAALKDLRRETDGDFQRLMDRVRAGQVHDALLEEMQSDFAALDEMRLELYEPGDTPLHPDTYLDVFTRLFDVLRRFRVEALKPYSAEQFAIIQILVIEKAVQELYDQTAAEGALLTRVLETGVAIDETMMKDIQYRRDEANARRAQIAVYSRKLGTGDRFFDSGYIGYLPQALKELDEKLDALDRTRRQIYAGGTIGGGVYPVTAADWQKQLEDVLDGIRQAEKLVTQPSEVALERNTLRLENKLFWVLVAAAAILIGLAVLYLFLRRRVLKPIVTVTQGMTDLAAGRIDVELPDVRRNDEIGRMIRALDVFKSIALNAQRLASFPERSPDCIFEFDATGYVTYVNPAARKTFSQIDQGDQVKNNSIFSGLKEIIDAGPEYDGDTEFLNEIGDRYYELYYSFPDVKDRHLVRLDIRDVTERIQREQELKKVQDRALALMNAVESSASALVIVEGGDMELPIIYANDAFYTLFDCGRDEMRRNMFHRIAGEKTDPATMKDIRAHMEKREVLATQFIAYRSGGKSFWCQLRLSPVFSDRNELLAYIFLFDDVTEERQHEDEEKQKHKMVALGQMAGGMAHEINNALQPVLGLSDALMMKFEDDEDVHQMLQIMHEYASYARHIVRDTLAFSRQEITETEYHSVEQVIPEVIALVEESIPDTVTVLKNGVGFDITPAKPEFISASKTGLMQILSNMCINACHAMDNEGTLSLNIRYDTSHDAEGRKMLLIRIVDTGCGMDKETMSSIFEPFFSTKDVGTGTGLGLSVVYGIVSDWGGDITVESQEGEGTTFSIYLPVYGEDEVEARKAAVAEEQAAEDGGEETETESES